MTLSEVFFSLPAMAVWGLCVGSFLNVVIHRVPRMMERQWRLEASEILELPAPDLAAVSLLAPPSTCPSCGHAIRWYENIPLASWLWLRGRCAACKTLISKRYPLVELVTAVLFVLIGWRVGAQPQALLWCGFAAALLAAALIDADTQLLPDDIVLPLLWAGLIAAALGWIATPLKDSVLGAAAGYASLWLIAKTYGLIRRIDEPMGAGDFKLLAVSGAWFGWELLPSIVLLSSAVGAIVGLVAIALNGRDWQAKLPFGPYLAGGGLAAFFFGAELTRLYFPAAGPLSLRIGLTGGIGSGKSTVAAMLIERGAVLFDTDAIARRLTAPGGAAVAAIAAAFGPELIAEHGGLDRERMRAAAFADAQQRRRLEAILHPLIGSAVDAEAAEVSSAAPALLFDVPLLVESSRWRPRVDRVWVVDCDEDEQVRRVVTRSGWKEAAVHAVIAQQATRAARRSAADAVLYNQGIGIDALETAVAALWASAIGAPH